MILLLFANVFAGLGLIENYFSFFALALCAMGALLDAIKQKNGPLLICAVVVGGFICIRGAILVLRLDDPFSLFYIDLNDRLWVLYLCASVISLHLGSRVGKSSSKGTYTKSHLMLAPEIPRPHRISSVFMVLIGFIFYGLYIIEAGGLGSLLSEYSAAMYQDIVKDQRTSTVKNLSIYFLIGGFTYYSASIRNSGLRGYFVLALAISILTLGFIKREYLFEVLIVLVYTLYALGYLKSKVSFAVIGVLIFGAMFSLFAIRSDIQLASLQSTLQIFNSAEFWIADQFIQVIQRGESTFSSDFGYRYILALVAPFLNFSEYVSVDWEITEASTGISGWGVPATAFGYLYLSFGVPGLICGSFFIGLLFTLASRAINSLGTELSRRVLFSLLFMYAWFFFRNGDPVSAVFYVNRYFFIISLVYLLTSRVPVSRT